MFYTIDRLEKDLAVCEDEKKQLHSIPLSRLGKGAREGDVFSEKNGVFIPAPEEKERRLKRIREKMNRLFQ